jgi:hypothetical protein
VAVAAAAWYSLQPLSLSVEEEEEEEEAKMMNMTAGEYVVVAECALQSHFGHAAAASLRSPLDHHICGHP